MSELINTHDNRATIRWKLLTGASAMALAAYVSSAGVARAGDASQIWIQFDGGFTQLDSDQELFQPAFTLVTPRKSFITSDVTGLQKNAPGSFDGDARISFEPSGSDWTLSLGIRYGRDNRHKFSQQQTSHPSRPPVSSRLQGYYFAYQTASASNSERHMMLDFQASKDVGLGMFGHNGHSAIGFGVRYAQLTSRNSFDIHYHKTNSYRNYDRFYASLEQDRKFVGLGPSLSWNASANIAGNANDGGMSFDWGVNAAALFGRQRAHGNHRAVEQFVSHAQYPGYLGHGIYNIPGSTDRSKNVVVPNAGGFAAISWFYPGAKVSIGYKADFFFNAIDGGIDARKTENRGFYGPYASISIGLGD